MLGLPSTITIATLPTVPTVGIPPRYLVIVAAIALVAVLVAIIWRYLWEERKDLISSRKSPKQPAR